MFDLLRRPRTSVQRPNISILVCSDNAHVLACLGACTCRSYRPQEVACKLFKWGPLQPTHQPAYTFPPPSMPLFEIASFLAPTILGVAHAAAKPFYKNWVKIFLKRREKAKEDFDEKGPKARAVKASSLWTWSGISFLWRKRSKKAVSNAVSTQKCPGRITEWNRLA